MQKANSYKKPNYCKKQTYYESKHILQKANTYEKANTAKTKPILILDRQDIAPSINSSLYNDTSLLPWPDIGWRTRDPKVQ